MAHRAVQKHTKWTLPTLQSVAAVAMTDLAAATGLTCSRRCDCCPRCRCYCRSPPVSRQGRYHCARWSKCTKEAQSVASWRDGLVGQVPVIVMVVELWLAGRAVELVGRAVELWLVGRAVELWSVGRAGGGDSVPSETGASSSGIPPEPAPGTPTTARGRLYLRDLAKDHCRISTAWTPRLVFGVEAVRRG